MRLRRVVATALIFALGFMLGALATTAYVNYRAAAEPQLSPKDSSETNAEGWAQLPIDPRWSLPPIIGTPGTRPFGGDLITYDALVQRINGTAPYSINGRITAVDDVYAIDLDAEQNAELTEAGSVCVMSSMVVQLPSADMSTLDERMNECNDIAAVAMTVIISEVL